jgi:hypothetical protein
MDKLRGELKIKRTAELRDAYHSRSPLAED